MHFLEILHYHLYKWRFVIAYIVAFINLIIINHNFERYSNTWFQATIFGGRLEIIYQVQGDDIIFHQDKSGVSELLQNTEQQQHVWQKFIQIIPLEARENLAEVTFYDNPHDKKIAFSKPLKKDLKQWQIGFNLSRILTKGKLQKEHTFHITMIHEIGHLLTLNEQEVNPDKKHCNTFLIQEGCVREKSILSKFRKKFWKPSLYAFEDRKHRYDFHASSFANQYAATDEVEDLAESFALFVYRDRPVMSSNPSDQKLNFFYRFPKMIILREHIRNNLLQQKNTSQGGVY